MQLDASTSGHTNISVQFDMCLFQRAAAQFAVEYTTDINDGTNAQWTNVTQDLSFGPNDGPNSVGVTPTIGNSPTNSVYIQNNAGRETPQHHPRRLCHHHRSQSQRD